MNTMESRIESNQRTLMIFDSVCSGLDECLALVHADIRQMTEHRNQLTSLKQREKSPLKLVNSNGASEPDKPDHDRQQDGSGIEESKIDPNITLKDEEPDPHHLARLKLLDKRLADSFSQALNMCDQQKSSLVTRKQQLDQNPRNVGHHRPSIFQVLLGKSSYTKNSNFNNNNNSIIGDNNKRRASSKQDKANLDTRDEPKETDSQHVIDDINRQTRLAMQYAKQLEAHLFRVEDLRARYEMHLKMGLLVKGVSGQHLCSTTSSSSGFYCQCQHSPNSLGRRSNQLYTSSLVINDNSSSGTTRSSLSSLNLSSWSFSRRNKTPSDRCSRQNSTTGSNCCGHMQAINDNSLLRNSNQKHNQKYMSTISLDSMKRRNKRLSLAKLISSSSNPRNACQPNLVVDHDLHLHNGSRQQSPNSNIEACDCHLTADFQGHLQSAVYESGCLSTPSPRPLSHYSDYVTPTTLGTPAHVVRGGDSMLPAMDQRQGCGSAKLLHKSTSHNSLKGTKHKIKQQHPQPTTASIDKATVKDFIENIERIETEFESYMGSFLLNVEDIQGFARVCQGDVFEINIKYGQSQKFKTKISVLKDSRQKCDNRQTVFKARIADVIAIKAYECKGLGKRVLLGHKLCETRDLFTARSQLMTISLNQTGSIKLNLIITWNPLHLAPNSSLAFAPGLDISHISLPPARISSSTLSSVSSCQSVNGSAEANRNGTTLINIQPINQRTKVSSQTSSRDYNNHHHHHQQLNSSPNGMLLAENGQMMDGYFEQVQHHHQLPDCNTSKFRSTLAPTTREHVRIYQGMDPSQSYYIPEPDYLVRH